MRKTSDSSKIWEITPDSSRADAKSWPKGFSMMTRRHSRSVRRLRPVSAKCWATTGNQDGGIDR